MRKILVFISIVVVFLGCSTPKENRKQNKAGRKIEQIKKEYPQLFVSDTSFVVKRDTITVRTLKETFDTTVLSSDTMIVTNDKVITRIERIKDTVTNIVTSYRVETVVLPDTFYIENVDTVFTINEEIVTKTEVINKTPWWIWLIVLGLCVLIVRNFLIWQKD